jgi:hypothetical protein
VIRCPSLSLLQMCDSAYPWAVRRSAAFSPSSRTKACSNSLRFNRLVEADRPEHGGPPAAPPPMRPYCQPAPRFSLPHLRRRTDKMPCRPRFPTPFQPVRDAAEVGRIDKCLISPIPSNNVRSGLSRLPTGFSGHSGLFRLDPAAPGFFRGTRVVPPGRYLHRVCAGVVGWHHSPK